MKSLNSRLEKLADWIALFMLIILFGRLLATSVMSSPTVDEVLHVFHGVAFWRVAPAEMLHNITNNPPLVNAIIGSLVNLALSPQLPLEPEVWGTGKAIFASQTFMWEKNPNGLQIIWVGRIAVIVLSLFLGALIYRWGKELFHDKMAALMPLFIYTFEPNILAHSAIATIDLGTAFFMFLAAYLLWRYWKLSIFSSANDSSGRQPAAWLMAAVGIGAVLGAKFSGLVIVPAIALMTLFHLLITGRRGVFKWRVLAEFIGMLLLAILVFFVIYRTDLNMLQSDFIWQRNHILTGHPSFLLGNVSRQGWWYYFPVVFAVKTPISVLLVIGLASSVFLFRRRFDWQLVWILLVAGGTLCASLISRVNIGYRYLLPALPLLFLFAGLLAWPLYRSNRFVRGTTILALSGLAVASITIHPDYLAFFNPIAGGPDNGWRVAADSNIDWGQDLGKLKDYLQSEGVDSVKGMWMSIVPSEVFGIDATFLYDQDLTPEQNEYYGSFYRWRPAPGVYIFSPSHLQGIFVPDQTLFQWFLDRPPDKKIGYSMFVYNVGAEGPPVGVALSGIGISHITTNDFDDAFASNDVRSRWYDARSTVLWPGGSPGGQQVTAWAAIGSAHWPSHPVLQTFYPTRGPDITGISENSAGDILNYSLFHWERSPIQEALLKDISGRRTYRAFGWSSEAVIGSQQWDLKRHSIIGPAIFDDSLQLLGYDVLHEDNIKPGATLEIISYWKVKSQPQPDLKIFLHVLDASGEVVTQHDGLDLVSDALQPGDEFAQLHTIFMPANLPGGRYGLQIGLYNHRSNTRLLVPTSEGEVDRLLLHTFDSE